MVLSNDISEIRTTERALRRSEHMLERSQSTAHVGSWEVALGTADGMPRGHRALVGRDVTGCFGYEPGAFPVTYTSFFDHIHPEDRERVRAGVAATRSSAASRSRTNFASSGPTGPCGSCTPGPTSSATPPANRSAWSAPARTSPSASATELELREADRRKDEFLAMLSHELRNPLAPILNAIEIIERAAPDDQRAAIGLPRGHRAAAPAHEAAARRPAGRLARQPGQDRAPQAAAWSWRRCCCRPSRSAGR